MAKTLLAAPIAGIRGKLGGLVYSANGSGTFVKPWNPPSNPQTPSQTLQRSYLSQMPALWRALSGAQRTAWDDFAALGAQALIDSLGETYYISGWLWFVKCNVRLLRVGRTPITAVPTIARPAAPTISAFSVTEAGTDVDLCTGGTAVGQATEPGFPADNAYDDNFATYWRTTAGTTSAYTYYRFPALATVRRYAIYFPTTTLPEAPLDWTFRYYVAPDYVILDTVTNYHPATAGWHSFPFTPPTYDDVFALFTTAVHGPAGNWISVHEIAMYEGLVDNSYIIYPEDEFHTVAYDLILHVAMTDSQAKSVQYPGYYEILATQTPGRKSTNFQAELAAAFGTILPGRRWFAKLYRQTSEGIRSAPATIATNTAA